MCARGAGTHGDVLNVHTGTCGVDTRVFSACHTPHTTHQTAHTPHHNTRHNIPQHTTTPRPQHFTKTETDRDRKRDRERRRRQKEKRREKIHFQCGGAWLFFVDLNTVNYDSSFISFSASWRVNSFFIICELNFVEQQQVTSSPTCGGDGMHSILVWTDQIWSPVVSSWCHRCNLL